MDFITFKKAAKLLPTDISVIMRGRHGIGKSEIVRQMAKSFDLPVIERRLSQVTEGDLLGLPKIEGKATYFLPPEWFVSAMETPCLLFLDEFDRSTREVQQAAMELVLDRSIQGKEIHKDCRVYSAINGGKHGAMYSINSIDPALNDRFWIADIEPSIEEWIKWGQMEGNVITEILDFIRINESELEKDLTKNSHEITPSRRSWTRLSQVFQNNPQLLKNFNSDPTFIAICTGFVGIHSAGLFRSFLQRPYEHIKAEDILDRFEENEERLKKFEIEHLNFAMKKIADHCIDPRIRLWSKSQAKNMSKFFRLLKPELQIALWDKLTVPETKLENVQLLSQYVSDLLVNTLTR